MKWKQFCNSLHLRMAIRISNIDETTAGAEISRILGDPAKYPVFTANEDNTFLAYPGGDWVEPWTGRHSSIGDDFIAKPIVDIMLNYTDPRLAYYADTIADGSYIGLEVGVDADMQYSRVNGRFVQNPTGSVYFLKYAEVEFIKAEAAQRGLFGTPVDAQNAYNAGITASCEEYGLGSTEIDNYLTGPSVLYASDLDQIYTQPWISLFRQSWEAWAEMRRTDIPTLPPATNSVHEGHNRPPFRFSYPDTEIKLNGKNIPEHVNEVDDYWGYQIWWDTRTGVQ